MKEDKYYEPKIEEFHKGFRFQILSSYGFINCIYPDVVETHFLMRKGDTLDKIEDKLDSCRVKILDQDDIEELGWEWEEYSLLRGDAMYTYYLKDMVDVYRLTYVPRLKSVRIVEKQGMEESDPLFHGEVKNYNELKKLMNQLGIKV